MKEENEENMMNLLLLIISLRETGFSNNLQPISSFVLIVEEDTSNKDFVL